jgi:hypothetical protein
MKFLTAIIMLFMFYGCQPVKNYKQPEKFDADKIKNLVTQAIDKDSTANNKLSNLVDFLADTNKYNSVVIDSLMTNKDTLYFVILENENPFYNRFAVYNSSLIPLLNDKSLNGNISYKTIEAAGKDFIETDESYLSKDTLLLNRISLYSIDSAGVTLAFRTHTKFSEPGNNFTQDLTEISDTLIQTKISGSKKSKINGKTDNFVFDSSTGKYLSSQNIFDEFIKKEIENFNYQPVKEQLTDTLKTN